MLFRNFCNGVQIIFTTVHPWAHDILTEAIPGTRAFLTSYCCGFCKELCWGTGLCRSMLSLGWSTRVIFLIPTGKMCTDKCAQEEPDICLVLQTILLLLDFKFQKIVHLSLSVFLSVQLDPGVDLTCKSHYAP